MYLYRVREIQTQKNRNDVRLSYFCKSANKQISLKGVDRSGGGV
jgi:hypothetical protein